MVTVPVPLCPSPPRSSTHGACGSADRSFRQRLSETLTGLRWQVREAEGGAQAWAEAESATPEAVIVDSWLPISTWPSFSRTSAHFFPKWTW